MWKWPAYSNIHFIRMYTIMNVAYILGMYELWRVIRTYLKPFANENHSLHFYVHKNLQNILSIIGILFSIILLIIPFIAWKTEQIIYMPYLMILPFFGMWISSDSITSLLKGKSISGEIIRGNKLYIISLIATVLSASLFTEIINLNAHEWIYNYMPFGNIQILSIPVAVFIGWTPLVVGVIALLNMIKHVKYMNIT